MGSNKITKEYFLKEYHDFRKLMSSKEYTHEQKLNAYQGLFYIYVNLNSDMPIADIDICRIAMESLDIELNMRLEYEFMKRISTIIEQIK